jgi:hypothetical protein
LRVHSLNGYGHLVSVIAETTGLKIIIFQKKKNVESIIKCILHAFMEIVILPILCPPACLNIVDLDMKLTTLLLGEILFVALLYL